MKIEISIDRESKVYELKALSLFAESLANGRHIEEVAGAVPAPSDPKSGLKYPNLETGRVISIGNPSAVEPIVTEKVIEFANEMAKAEVAGGDYTQQSKIEALADKVAEATQVNEEPEEYTVEAVISMTEEEMKSVPTTILVEALASFGIDPSTRPGKNTNAKLRGLLISAIADAEKEDEAAEKAEETEKVEDIKPQEEPESPEEGAPEEDAPEENAMAEEEITIDVLRNVARGLIAANKRKTIAEAFEACGCSNFSTLKKQDYAKFYELCQN
ncbi:hypothetical protein BT638P8_00029 [Bacteroides phage BT638P8]|nr:hypothetical protein BT638P8_00029 [Bacteroides phage BT638P8]